jgi:hypothetical protein
LNGTDAGPAGGPAISAIRHLWPPL